MKAWLEMAQAYLRSGDDFATKVSTCRRLAGGIRNLSVDELGLTAKEQETLAKAHSLLQQIATTYDKAAAEKKRVEALRAQRVKDVREAMKSNFETLSTVADKVAFIASQRRYALDFKGMCYEAKTAGDVGYILSGYFVDCLSDLASGIAWSSAADLKDLDPAAAVTLVWQRFQDRRADLQDKHAATIVRFSRLSAPEAVARASGVTE